MLTTLPFRKLYDAWALPILALAAALLGAALYSETLHFTLYWDDVNSVRAIQENSLVALFTRPTALGHYRPLSLLPLELTADAAGRVPALPVHLLALALHILNGWMVGLLARTIQPDKPGVHLLAAALYLTFPFSYQAAPWVSSIAHISAVTGTLAALIFLERWRRNRGWLDYGLTLLGVFVANFSHEAATTSGAVLALWLLVRHEGPVLNTLRQNWRAAAKILVPALAINLLYVALWSLFRDTEKYAIVEYRTSLLRNPIYFLQALTYPASQFGFELGQRLAISDTAAALLLGGLGLAVLGGGLWLRRDRRAWLVVGWFALAALIPIGFLDWQYVLVSPRILVQAAPAIALGWALAISGLWEKNMALRAGTLLIAGLALIGGAVFIRTRLELQTQMDRLYDDIYAAVERDGDGAVVFNVPAWISPRQRVFALGTEGIVYKAEYYSFDHLVEVNTGIDYRTRPILWHDNLPIHDAYWIEFVNEFQPSLDERLAAVRGADRFYRVKALPHQFVLEEASPATDGAVSEGWALSNGVRLAAQAALIPGENVVRVDLALQTVRGQVEEKVFVHLLCGDQMLTQADGALMGEIYPYDYWSAGETWREGRMMELPEGTPAECLRVRIGMYHPATGMRPTFPDGSEWVIIPVGNQENR